MPKDEDFCHQASLRSRDAGAVHLAPGLAEWRFFRWRNAQNPCLILQQAGVDVGHVIVTLDDETLWVEEWAAPEISEEVMLLTLQQMAATVGRSKICGWFPEKRSAPFIETQRPDAVPMMLFFDPDLQVSDASFWSIEHF